VSSVTRAADGTVTGNTYDKYGSRNPVVRLMMRTFDRNLQDLFVSTEPSSLLDVGCGEGVLTQRWAAALAPQRVVGIDLEDPLLAAEWRVVNMARGAYWRELGNTPGHVNHFSKAAIVELCRRHGDVIESRSPFPWTMVLVRV